MQKIKHYNKKQMSRNNKKHKTLAIAINLILLVLGFCGGYAMIESRLDEICQAKIQKKLDF